MVRRAGSSSAAQTARYAGSGRIGCHGAVPISSPRYTRIPALRGRRRISRTVVGCHVAPVTVGTPRRRRPATICRIGTPASSASAAVTISAASAGLTLTPSRPNPNGRGPPALYCPASARRRRAAATRRAVSGELLFATAHMTRASVMSASLARCMRSSLGGAARSGPLRA